MPLAAEGVGGRLGFMRMRVVFSVLVALIALAGCGGDSNAGGAEVSDIPEDEWVDETGKPEITIDARDNVFVPENVIVSPGTRIRFENVGRAPHNVIAVNDGQFEDIPVDDLQPGDIATLTLDDNDEYPYYCSLHGTPTKGMIGRIRVEG